MSQTDQLIRSGNRLQQQSLLFLQQTRQSGVDFATETRSAGVTFSDEVASAATKLARSTGRSASTLGRVFRKEAVNWRDLVIKTREAYLGTIKSQVGDLENRAASVREALRPTALEASVLRTSHDLLGGAQELVDERLALAKEPTKPPRKTTKKARPTAPKAARTPIRNYDQLTAKDVVARIQRLSDQQATVLLDYEQTRKNRATVIRAAKQRLAAS